MGKRFFSWFSRRFGETPETVVFLEGTTTKLFEPTADGRPRDSSRQQTRILCGQTRILCGPPPCDLSVVSSKQTTVGAVGVVSAAVGGSSAAVPATPMTVVGDSNAAGPGW